MDNHISCYKPKANITTPKQPFPTKARCRLTQYMPKKPDKFVIKFWSAVNVETKYILNAIPYLGKDETRVPSQILSNWVVRNFVKSYFGKGRNIAADNFFTSVIAEEEDQHGGNDQQSQKKAPPISKNNQATGYSNVLMKADDIVTLSTNASENKMFVFLALSIYLYLPMQAKTKCLCS